MPNYGILDPVCAWTWASKVPRYRVLDLSQAANPDVGRILPRYATLDPVFHRCGYRVARAGSRLPWPIDDGYARLQHVSHEQVQFELVQRFDRKQYVL